MYDSSRIAFVSPQILMLVLGSTMFCRQQFMSLVPAGITVSRDSMIPLAYMILVRIPGQLGQCFLALVQDLLHSLMGSRFNSMVSVSSLVWATGMCAGLIASEYFYKHLP